MADAKYFVKKVQTCPKCAGKQVVQHPAWTEYWNEHKGKHNPEMTLEYDRKWFEDHGWAGSLYMSTDGLPDEEIYCGECEGEGEIVSEIDLFDVLPELLESLKTKE